MLAAVAGAWPAGAAEFWQRQWPRTDFGRHAVPLGELMSGGPPKDGIPAIDSPRFLPLGKTAGLGELEPVIAVDIGGDARAYPLRIFLWHEIVNDTVGGTPVAVTYCPLCNSAVLFDRRLGSRVLDFGVSGLLRHSDLVMYDRQTESFWQQFLGEAIVGELTGARLKMLPARVESLARFRARYSDGRVLAPPDDGRRPYGVNPYAGYDGAKWPFLFRGDYSDPVPPLSRVVSVGKEAWPLDLLRQRGTIHAGDLVLTWEAGQNSPLDADRVAEGRDIGNVVVQRRQGDRLEDAVHDIGFAFAFRAFHPDGVLHLD